MADPKIEHWDKMYALPLEQIPWEIKDAPKELVELIRNRVVTGGCALDIACGTGNYSVYLAQHGFNEVVGIDFSENALQIAKKNNEKFGLPIRYIFGDVTKLAEVLRKEQFDFILDYSILHHLNPSVTENYAGQCVDLLKPGGKLLLVCYSDKDEFASGSNAATGTYGNTMFYRTADEIRHAYKNLHEVSYKETRLGKRLHHIAHSFLFEK
ncbi:MAG TPA: methyltransferase domain-containing protein [Patescibacteria group bacterium]|nr:methyltransferase domain-containing protein [Patescibacteria group bacterium]